MAKISLDPQELKNQALQMSTLGAEYETLFSGVNSILVNVNSNWSQNLSNNFSGKISAAQRSFSQVTDMLKFGADAANSSAESFESIDFSLSRVMGDGTVLGGSVSAQAFSGTDSQMVNNTQNVKKQSEISRQHSESKDIQTLKKIKEVYDKVPKWAQELIDEYIEENGAEDLQNIIELLWTITCEDPDNWLKLDVDPDIVEGIAKLFIEDSLYVKAVKETFDSVMNNTTMKQLDDIYHYIEHRGQQKILEGDILGGIGDFGLGMLPAFGEIIYGVGDVLTELISGVIRKPMGLINSITKTLGYVPGEYGENAEVMNNIGQKVEDTICGFLENSF